MKETNQNKEHDVVQKSPCDLDTLENEQSITDRCSHHLPNAKGTNQDEANTLKNTTRVNCQKSEKRSRHSTDPSRQHQHPHTRPREAPNIKKSVTQMTAKAESPDTRFRRQ